MDNCPANKEISSRVSRNGIEMAILDLWGKLIGEPVSRMISSAHCNISKPSFYTVSLSTNINDTISSTNFGLNHSPYLKIKLNRDLEIAKQILRTIHSIILEKNIKHCKLSIDANSDWTPEITEQFLDIIKEYKDYVYMLEQPFPVIIPEEDKQKWIALKHKYEQIGIYVYADESFATAEDTNTLSELVSGVNIKLDKTGGIRNALFAVKTAQSKNLRIWSGMMVGSSLATTATSVILPFTTFGGDLDGTLLVKSESDMFESELKWDPISGNISLPQTPGIGVKLK
jgi:L-alanine-DL-glutamate epimerase-like enolase superfamily enzyme